MTATASVIQTLILGYFPDIRNRHPAVIEGWIADGVKWNYHIFPVMTACLHRAAKPESFGYFTPAIMKEKNKTDWFKKHKIYHPVHNACAD